MRIGRAHSYDAVEACRAAIGVMPKHWLRAIDWVSWWLLPPQLCPLWVGLLKFEETTHDGRLYSKVGGWFANDRHAWMVSNTPHIYLAEEFIAHSAVHEAAHALADAWHVDEAQFYRPEVAFYPYMASNPSEYFACAVEAFFIPANNERLWNCEDLARTNPALHEWLRHQSHED